MLSSDNYSVGVIIEFIRKYRYMEYSILEEGYRMCRFLAGDNDSIYQHLCGQWKGKKREFASFYLNLGTQKQVRLLNEWGLVDPDDEAYLAIEFDSPEKYLFATAPGTVLFINNILRFFENHGIESFTPYDKYPGLELSSLPHEKKRYGNSTNWGDYLLSLKNPRHVLDQIVQYNLVK